MKLKKLILNIIIIIAATAVLAALAGILCSLKPKATMYMVPIEEIGNDVRIVLISDLHGRVFGKNNEELEKLAEVQKPDIIAVAGDLINRNSSEADIEKMCGFLCALSEIAPTYFSIGNHETEYMIKCGDDILERVKDTGVTVLECDYEDLCINGTQFRLGGMSELAYKGGDGEFDPKAEEFLTEYCNTELPTVLMSHRPEAFCFKDACSFWDIDLVLSGHTHGGLIRLPVVGGLAAPIQGLFPRYYYGEYDMYDTRVIITSGLAGYCQIPRMFNPPEICVITLTAKG